MQRVLLAAVLVLVPYAVAQETEPAPLVLNIGAPDTQAGVNCFDYYRFGDVQVNGFHTEKFTYRPGEVVKARFVLDNQTPYPVAEANVYIKVFRENPAYNAVQGDDQMDFFSLPETVSLLPFTQYPVEFEWRVPDRAPKGRYLLAAFVQSGKKFDLAGLPFIENVYASLTFFEVESDTKNTLYFDRAGVHAQGEPYLLRSFPLYAPTGDFEAVAELVNPTAQALTATVKQELFYWNQTDPANILPEYTVTSTQTLEPGQRVPVPAQFENLPAGGYYLRLTAKAGGRKSVLGIRFGAGGPASQIIYQGVTRYPLEEDKPAELVSCINALDPYNPLPVRLTQELLVDGRPRARSEWSGTITGSVMGYKTSLPKGVAAKEFTLRSRVYDTADNLLDEAETRYRLEDFYRAKTVAVTYSNDELHVTVHGPGGEAVAGRFNLWVVGASERVLLEEKNVEASTFRRRLELAPGDYRIVVESTEQAMPARTQRTFTVAKTPPQPPENEKEGPGDKGGAEGVPVEVGLAALAIVIFLAAALGYWRRRK